MSYYNYFSSFIAVYRLKSITRAAEKLSLTQPTITSHIQSLEQHVGKPLFQRHAKGVIPTDAAQQLALDIAPHIDALDYAVAQYDSESEMKDMLINLGITPDMLYIYLESLSKIAMDGIRINFIQTHVAELVEDLKEGKIDFLISNYYHADPTLSHIQLDQENLGLVYNECWQDTVDELFEGKNKNLLSDAKWVLYHKNQLYVKRFILALYQEELTVKPAVVVHDLHALIQFIKDGVGISVIALNNCREYLSQANLKIAEHPDNNLKTAIFLSWNSTQLKDSKLIRARDIVVQHLTTGAEEA